MSDGGVLWEQTQALERAIVAMRAGDYDAMALALADFAAALGTRTTSTLSAMLVPILEQLRALHMQRDSDVRARDHKLDLIILAVERISAATLAESLSASARAELIAQIAHIPGLERRVGMLEQQIERTDDS